MLCCSLSPTTLELAKEEIIFLLMLHAEISAATQKYLPLLKTIDSQHQESSQGLKKNRSTGTKSTLTKKNMGKLITTI